MGIWAPVGVGTKARLDATGSVHFDIHVKTLRHSLGKNGVRVRKSRKKLLYLGSDFLNPVQIRTYDHVNSYRAGTPSPRRLGQSEPVKVTLAGD
jgi:hypothetical protein